MNISEHLPNLLLILGIFLMFPTGIRILGVSLILYSIYTNADLNSVINDSWHGIVAFVRESRDSVILFISLIICLSGMLFLLILRHEQQKEPDIEKSLFKDFAMAGWSYPTLKVMGFFTLLIGVVLCFF